MKTKFGVFLGTVLLAAGAAAGADFYADCFQESNSTVFASGLQRWVKLHDGGSAVAKNNYSPTAGALGYVYRTGPWHAGASFSYEQGDRKYAFIDGSSAKIKSSIPGVTLFGGWKNPDGWYVDGSAFAGFATLKSRGIADGTGVYNGSTEHNTMFGASIEAGKAFRLPSEFVLKPHVGFDYAYAPGESYTYNNGVWVTRSASSQSFYEIPLGVSFSRTFNCGNWAITPEVDVTMVNSLGGMNENYYPGFASRTADQWKVYGIGGDHIGGRVRAGLNANLNKRTTMGLDYTFEGRSGYQDHRISALFGWSF